MSQVTLSIGGRKYTVACADGQESHVQSLADSIDAKLAEMGKPSPQDTQNLLFASLLLADDLYETKAALTDALATQSGAAQNELQALKSAQKTGEEAQTLLETQIATLQHERDLLEQRVHELAATPPQPAPMAAAMPLAGTLDLASDLAPSLERFAQLLENCADKLEAGAATH